MAADESNLLGTPSGYATPGQLEDIRAYSKLLLKHATEQPVQHWSQGISNMVSALVGGHSSFMANQKQNEADAVRGGRMTPDISGGPIKDGPKSFSEGTASEGPKVAGGADTDRSSNAIAGIESGGRYDKLGPVIPKTGDRAYGKYQVMGANVPEWTAQHVGRKMTPEEFLADPKAQEAVFKGKFGEYTNKYGPEGAARAWFAGEGGMNNPKAKDMLGTTVSGYSQKFSKAYGPDANQTMARTIKPDMAPTQVAEMQTAAKGAPGGVAPQPRLQNPDPAPGGKIYIPPSLVPTRPRLNEGQMRGIMSDPTIDPQTRELRRQEYIQQNQPIEVPAPDGFGTIVIDPRDPTKQYRRTETKWGKSKVGDVESDTPYRSDDSGNIVRAPILSAPTVGPRSEAPPVVAPVGGPAGASPIVQAASAPAAAAASAAPPAPPAAPIQATGPATATAGIEPPAASPVEAARDVQQAEGPLAQWAQARPPGVEPGNTAAARKGLQLQSVDPALARDYEAKKAYDIKADLDKDAQLEGNKLAMKKYDTMSSQAQAARKLVPNLQIASHLMDDPNFSSGMLHGVKDTWQRFKDAVGLEKGANAPNETFDKLMASTVLDTMKTALAGLGQVRLAEIALLQNANANRGNTVASNRAVLDISKRALEKLDQLDSMGQSYVSGDEVINPATGKVMLKANLDANGEIVPRRGLDAGFDKLARKFTNDHPSYTKEEIQRFNDIFQGKGEGAPVDTATKPGAAMEREFDDGKGGKVKGVSTDGGKTWGPVPAAPVSR